MADDEWGNLEQEGDPWAIAGGGREYPEERNGQTYIVKQDPFGNYSESLWNPPAAEAVAAGPDMWAKPEGGRGYPETLANGATQWVNQDVGGNYTAKPWQQTAPVPAFAQWAQEFTMIHGREPEAKDYQDKVWMDEFVAKQGRFPTREEWVRNWYAKKASARNYAPEFVPFKNIGGAGGWQKEWGAPQTWNPNEDWNTAYERIGLAAQNAAPENRANSLATQRLIGSSLNYQDYLAKSDAILAFLKQFEKPVETKKEEETAAATGGPGGAIRTTAPVTTPLNTNTNIRGIPGAAPGGMPAGYGPGDTDLGIGGTAAGWTPRPVTPPPSQSIISTLGNMPGAQGLSNIWQNNPQWQIPDWMQAMNPLPGLQRSAQNLWGTITNPTANQQRPNINLQMPQIPNPFVNTPFPIGTEPQYPGAAQPFNAIPQQWR